MTEWELWIERHLRDLEGRGYAAPTRRRARVVLGQFRAFLEECGVSAPQWFGPKMLRDYQRYRAARTNLYGRRDQPSRSTATRWRSDGSCGSSPAKGSCRVTSRGSSWG